MTRGVVDTGTLLHFLVQRDEKKGAAVERLFASAAARGMQLFVLPVSILEIVAILERVYLLPRRSVRELVEAIINTPQLKIEMGEVFLRALKAYEERGIDFSAAVNAFWALERGTTTIFSYTDQLYEHTEGLVVEHP